MPHIGIALFAAAAIAALAPWHASAADEPPAAAPRAEPVDEAAPSRSTLPPAPGRIGRVRRDEQGRIVPDGPPLPADERAVGTGYPSSPPAIGGVPLDRGTRPTAPPPLGFYDPNTLATAQDRRRHAIEAKRRQLVIDRILHQEAEAKRAGAAVDSRGLTPRENAMLRELERIDREVRDHEMAHYFTGRPYAAFPEYWFVTGPLGRQFAVSGMTRMDTSPIGGDEAATIRKLEHLKRAALAPREPSDEDRRVVTAIERLIARLRQRAGASRR